MNTSSIPFSQVLEMAQQYQMPITKQRGIIREYLQSKFIEWLYAQPHSKNLSFIGGTSLRLLRNLPRFSEDLDFDVLDLAETEVIGLITETARHFTKENIEVELIQTQKDQKTYFTLRFPNLLHDLEISSDPREKLMIKVDYTSFWHAQTPEAVLFSRYGVIEQVVTNPLNQVLVQKLAAYVRRPSTQPRDMYDVVWLYAQGARIDQGFALANHLPNLVRDALEKLSHEGITPNMRRKLQPFLFVESELTKLELFGEVLKKL